MKIPAYPPHVMGFFKKLMEIPAFLGLMLFTVLCVVCSWIPWVGTLMWLACKKLDRRFIKLTGLDQ